MPYNRHEFLDLFLDSDPYEYIWGDWESAMGQAQANLDYAAAKLEVWSISSREAWDTNAVDSMRQIIQSFLYLFGLLFSSDPDEGTGNMLLNVTTYGALYNQVNAESIMSAWINTTKQIRLMTVLTIDELRREVWNEEIVSYKIAPPLGDS